MKRARDLLTGLGLLASLVAFSQSIYAGQVVLQPGPGEGKDIWTTSVYSYAPGGGGPGGGLDNEWLQIGGWGDLYYTLIEFNLTGMPLVALSAKLELFVGQNKGDGTTDMYLDRITEFWDWKSQGTGPDRERLWWADRPPANQWISSSLPAPAVGQWYSIDITDLYNAWQNGTYPNYGVQLRPVSNNNRWNEVYSSDYIGDPSLRPKLVVEASEDVTFQLGFPLESEYWMATTYSCHQPLVPGNCVNAEFGAVDFRYAATQTPGSREGCTILKWPWDKNVIASHDGVLQMVRDRIRFQDAGDVLQTSLRLIEANKSFATWYVHLTTLKIGDWVFVYPAESGELNLRNCAGRACAVESILRADDVMQVMGGPRRKHGYTWWKLRGIVRGETIEGWAVEAVAIPPKPKHKHARRVLLNVLFHIGDTVITTEGGINLRQCPSTDDNLCPVAAQLRVNQLMEVVRKPKRKNGRTWWKLEGVIDGKVAQGWVAETAHAAETPFGDPPKLPKKASTSRLTLGKMVTQGTVLGQVADLGHAFSGSHLHYAVQKYDRTSFYRLDDEGLILLDGEVAFDQSQKVDPSTCGEITYTTMPRH